MSLIDKCFGWSSEEYSATPSTRLSLILVDSGAEAGGCAHASPAYPAFLRLDSSMWTLRVNLERRWLSLEKSFLLILPCVLAHCPISKKNPFRCLSNVTKTSYRISSTYLLAVRVPVVTDNCRESHHDPPPLSPPNLSRSRTQFKAKRSSKLRKNHYLLSALVTFNLDSSEIQHVTNFLC